MPNHMDFFRASSKRVGVIDPGVVVNVATSVIDFASSIFGKDAVPDYPIKSGSTYTSLKASVIEWVGVVAPKGRFEPAPPSSVDQAKIMLAKAIKRKNEEIQLGHGYGDGVGWDTLQMLYDETIRSLQVFIEQGGLSSTYSSGTFPTGTLPTGTTYPYPTQTGSGFGQFIKSNPLLVAGGVAAIIYFITRKKRR